MIGREKRVLLRHYLEQGMNKAVIARDLGVSRRTVYHWIENGPGVGRRACRVRSEMSDAVEAGSVQAVDRHASQGVPEAHGCTALQGGPGRWLPGQLQPSEALCTQGPASTPRGAGRALRDGAWASGPGGLRPLPATVGQALRTNRRAGLLEAAVGSVLHPADHEGPDAWPGVFVFLLRRRALRASVR